MKSKIKILHFITNSCDHPYLYTVTNNADKDRFSISVGSLNSAGDLQKYYQKQNIQTFALEADNYHQFPQAVLKLVWWLKKNQIDIIQTHLFEASIVGLMAAKIARVPVKIFTGHHSHEMQFYKGKPTFWCDSLASRIFADYIIAPSVQMKQLFVEQQNINSEKIEVVHHGFDFSRWNHSEAGRKRIRREFNLENKIVFGAVGKIFWIKDYPLLLKSFATIAKKYPDVMLMIVGTGDETELRQLANELDIKNQIIFTGWRKDVTDLFAAMDIFVHSALAESFGLVITEAMAMGKPVICTEVGIAREIIKEGINGFLILPGDQENFANALENIIKLRSEWNDIGIANRKRVQEFTANKMVVGYESRYLRWYQLKNLS